MSFVLRLALVVLLLSATATTQAQSWEVAGLIGFTPTVDLQRRAPELDTLDIAGGPTWGAQIARYISPHWGVEGSWTWQPAALRIGNGPNASDLFDLDAMQLHGSAIYRFRARDARVQPFVQGGLGATFFSADDLQSETRLSLGIGGGVNYFIWRSLGIRGQARYKPTMVGDEDAGDFCDPFGFCQGTLHQFELTTGLSYRF